MKKTLHLVLFLLFISFSFASLVQAQGNNNCTVERVGIQVSSVVPNGNGCTITANLFFVAKEQNNGQKFFNLHLWEAASRPAGLNLSDPLSTSQLNAALANFVIQDFGTGNRRDWRLSRLYNRVDPNPAIDFSGVTLYVFRVRDDQPIPPGQENFRGYSFFVLSNVVFTTTASCNALNLVADVTGSQSANNNNIQCTNPALEVFPCEIPQQGYQPTAFADLQCNNPVTFTVGFANAGGCLPYYITYSVYADLNRNGVVDAGDPLVSGGPSADFAIVFPGATTVSSPRALTGDAANANLIVTNIRTSTVNNTGTGVLEQTLDDLPVTNTCIILPVSFKSFNAVRSGHNRQQVDLTWETAQEQNNHGFYVQRKTAGDWENVAFVPSATSDGNSSEVQRYRFTDNNTFSGMTQYRLQQQDRDGKVSYSDVKTVRGLTQQAGLVVYPNPAVNGKATLLFSDVLSNRDVWISDVSGRVVKQYREVAENTLAVEGLASGFYTIKVLDKKTNTVQIAKLVVH